MDINKRIDIIMEIGGRTLKIGRDHEAQLLPQVEGLEDVIVEPTLSENYNYPGHNLDYSHISYREIVLPILFTDLSRTEEIRQTVRRFFNPFYHGKMYIDYGGYERQIYFEVKSRKEKERTLWEPLEIQVVLVCEDPFWSDLKNTSSPIYTWVKGWQWPWRFPFQFRERGETRKTIYNDGDVPTPVEIIFPGIGLNPKIINHTTGEWFQCNVKLRSNEIMYVRSTFRDKQVIVYSPQQPDGVDAFDKINPDGDFLELWPGENDLEFLCDEPDLMPQGVVVVHRNKYLGV